MKRCAVPCLGLVVLLLPAMAMAQVDPAPDGIGLYFDPTATQVAATVTATPEAPAELTAYLIATRVAVAGTWGAVKSLYGRQGPGQAWPRAAGGRGEG
jgi:hypothetical protein